MQRTNYNIAKMLAGCGGAGCNPSVGETEDHGNFEAGLGYTQHLLGQSRLYNKTLFQRKVRMNCIIGIIINKAFIEHNAILLKAVKSPDES